MIDISLNYTKQNILIETSLAKWFRYNGEFVEK